MSAPSSAPAVGRSVKSDARRTHRWVCIVGGSLAVVGAALAAFVDPAWAALAAVGGVALIAFPDRQCCDN
jgi:hypothetical protein